MAARSSTMCVALMIVLWAVIGSSVNANVPLSVTVTLAVPMLRAAGGRGEGGKAPRPALRPPLPNETEGPPGQDAEGGRGPRRSTPGPPAGVLYREGLLRQAPQVHAPEIHGASWAHGELDPGDS